MLKQNLFKEISKNIVKLIIILTVLVLFESFILKIPITLYLCIMIYISSTSMFLIYSLNPKQLKIDIKKELSEGKTGDIFLAIPIMQFISFILVCRSIYIFDGPKNFRLLPNSISFFTWILYGVDNLIRVIFFDASEIYGISVSKVDHKASFWLSTLIFTYRLTVSLGLLKLMLIIYKKIIRR